MTIRLLNWAGREHFVEIPDDTEQIRGIVLSGDMVLIEPTYFNTDPTRIIDFYDGEFVIKREDFHKLESIEDSYEVFEIGENDLEE